MKSLHDAGSKAGIPKSMFLKRFFREKLEQRKGEEKKKKKRQLIETVSGQVRGQRNGKTADMDWNSLISSKGRKSVLARPSDGL